MEMPAGFYLRAFFFSAQRRHRMCLPWWDCRIFLRVVLLLRQMITVPACAGEFVWKGVFCLYEAFQKRLARFGAALLAAVVLCGAPLTVAAKVNVPRERMLVPVGHTVGIKLFSKGVMVVKLSEGGTPARSCGLKTGDVILTCDGDSVTSSEQFQSLLQENGSEVMQLQVKREGENVTLSVEPEQNEQGVYCIGAWIRDSMAGIGHDLL